MNIEKDIRNSFASIIGQTRAKNILIQSCLAKANGGELSSPLILGPAGLGKTRLIEAYASAAEKLGLETKVVTPSDIRKVDSEAWAHTKSIVSNPNYLVGFDETHLFYDSKENTVQLGKMRSFMMRALDGNFKGGQLAISDDFMAHFDRKNSALVLGTNYPGKLPPALVSRAEVIHLALYSESELVDILQLMLGSYGLHANEESLGIIARCGRGTARPMEQIVRTLNRNLVASGADKKSVNKEEIMRSLVDLEMFPRGFSLTEVQVMDALHSPLTERMILARFPQLDIKTWRESVGYMLSTEFVIDNRSTYQITKKGERYLQSCREAKFSWTRK